MFIILELFDPDFVNVVCDEDGKTKYFKTIEQAANYRVCNCQEGMIVDLDKEE
jgi:hypothetical protein